MKNDNNEHILEPASTEAVPLDRHDRYTIQEMLLYCVEERTQDDELEKHLEELADHVVNWNHD